MPSGARCQLWSYNTFTCLVPQTKAHLGDRLIAVASSQVCEYAASFDAFGRQLNALQVSAKGTYVYFRMRQLLSCHVQFFYLLNDELICLPIMKRTTEYCVTNQHKLATASTHRPLSSCVVILLACTTQFSIIMQHADSAHLTAPPVRCYVY